LAKLPGPLNLPAVDAAEGSRRIRASLHKYQVLKQGRWARIIGRLLSHPPPHNLFKQLRNLAFSLRLFYCSRTKVDLSAFLSLAMPSPNLHIRVTLLVEEMLRHKQPSSSPLPLHLPPPKSLHTLNNTYPWLFTHSKSATQFLIAPDR
jgi:hypothetical protein